MLIRKVVTMAKVIEPIALLSLRILRHNSATRTASNALLISTATPPTSASCPVGSMRWLSTSSIQNFTSSFADLDERDSLDPTPTKKQKKSSKTIKKNVSAPKPKTPIDPEKKKKAKTVIKLNHINKQLFGELLESSKERAKRIKKEETEQAKNSQQLFGYHEPPLTDVNFQPSLQLPSVSMTDTNFQPSVQLPSVSKILNKTMPKEQALALERWQAKMILQMGEEGFRLYKENMLNNGKMLHSSIETFLRGTPMNEIVVAESILGHWNSLQNILPLVEDVAVLESRVVHPTLKYCGIVDCVAVYKNKLVVIDWKTSQKQKPIVSMTYDTPVQITAYIGAINSDPNYNLKITEGLIVIAYEDGKTGHTFLLKPEDVAKYWEKWTQRLKQFHALNETENNN